MANTLSIWLVVMESNFSISATSRISTGFCSSVASHVWVPSHLIHVCLSACAEATLVQWLCVTGGSHRVECWFWASPLSLPESLFSSVFGAALLSAMSWRSWSSRLLPGSAQTPATEQRPYTGAVVTLALYCMFLTQKLQKQERRASLLCWEVWPFHQRSFCCQNLLKFTPLKLPYTEHQVKFLSPSTLNSVCTWDVAVCRMCLISDELLVSLFPVLSAVVAHWVHVTMLILILWIGGRLPWQCHFSEIASVLSERAVTALYFIPGIQWHHFSTYSSESVR